MIFFDYLCSTIFKFFRIMRSIKQKKLRRLNNVEAYVFMHSVQMEAESSTVKDVVELSTELKEKLSEYSSALKMKKTKGLTKQITDVFDNLNEKFRDLKQFANATLKMPDTILSSDRAAKIVSKVITEAVNTVTAPKSKSFYSCVGVIKVVISSIIDEVEPKILEESGFKNTIDDIEKLTSEFESLYAERNKLRALRKQKIAQFRKESEVAYKLLADFIEVKANMGDKDCQLIVTHVNESLVWLPKKVSEVKEEISETVDSENDGETTA